MVSLVQNEGEMLVGLCIQGMDGEEMGTVYLQEGNVVILMDDLKQALEAIKKFSTPDQPVAN